MFGKNKGFIQQTRNPLGRGFVGRTDPYKWISRLNPGSQTNDLIKSDRMIERILRSCSPASQFARFAIRPRANYK